jgi:hypothetical protein
MGLCCIHGVLVNCTHASVVVCGRPFLDGGRTIISLVKKCFYDIHSRATLNHTPLKYRCLMKIINWIRHVYLRVVQEQFTLPSHSMDTVCRKQCLETPAVSYKWTHNPVHLIIQNNATSMNKPYQQWLKNTGYRLSVNQLSVTNIVSTPCKGWSSSTSDTIALGRG